MAELRIGQILTMIHTTLGEFEIEFIRKDGSERVIKPRVRIGVPPSEGKMKKLRGEPVVANKSWGHQINRSHNLLLFDIQKNRPFEIKIALLMAFNKILVRWHNEK
jgi:hypothetical protein